MIISEKRKYPVVISVISLLVLLCLAILILRDRTGRPPDMQPTEHKTSQVKPDISAPSPGPATSPEPPKPKTLVSDNLELPYPEDVKAVADFYGKPGLKRLSDAEVVWQKREDEYINFLRNESFETGTYLTYMTCELTQLRALRSGFVGCSFQAGDIVKDLCRTRRFSKLMRHVAKAKDSAKLQPVIEVLTANVDRFIKEAMEVEDKLEKLVDEEPHIFRKDAPDKQRRRFRRLYSGYSLSGLTIPEGTIRMSIEGASLGLAANSFLLGLTCDPASVAPLLKIADYENTQFQMKFSSMFPDPWPIVEKNSLANYVVIADALDRILATCAETESKDVSPAAKAIARQYLEFRAKQNLPPREQIKVYPYDAPQTPYSIRGSVTGNITPVELTPVSLPLPLAKEIPRTPLYEKGITEQIAPILQYAQRFQKALKAKP